MNRLMLLGFINNQVHRLLSLIKSSKDGCKKLSCNMMWILEIEACNHMKSNLNVHEKRENIDPFLMDLLDGVVRMTSLPETADLSPKLKWKKVLYVPKLACNLISIF